MPALVQRILEPRPGTASRNAGLFLWQLDDQSRRLTEDTRGATPEELAWQPAPGMNTIGMLLAHIAIVEVYWTQVGPLEITAHETESVIGIGIDDDGMPIPEGGAPPAGLRGRDLAWYEDLLGRARAYSRRAISALGDADLDREITRRRRNGEVHASNMRWILYHMVEHFAGHYGQINLLAHQARIVRGAAERAG
jgi:uncharacterized damage-inducible protein DinB